MRDPESAKFHLEAGMTHDESEPLVKAVGIAAPVVGHELDEAGSVPLALPMAKRIVC